MTHICIHLFIILIVANFETQHLFLVPHLLSSKKLDKDSKTIIKSVNSELAQEISNYFNIDIKNFGVGIDDSKPREITKDDKKNIHTDNFAKYLMMFFAFVVVVILAEGYSSGNIQEQNSAFLGWISLFIVLFALLLIKGKEQLKEDQLIVKNKYNITTKPLPTKDEQLEVLEAKIDMLLKEKEDS